MGPRVRGPLLTIESTPAEMTETGFMDNGTVSRRESKLLGRQLRPESCYAVIPCPHDRDPGHHPLSPPFVTDLSAGTHPCACLLAVAI